MASDMEPTTPSSPRSIRTPSAPRLGFFDIWAPSTPRKSARLASQNTTARTRTPSPRPLLRELPTPHAAKQVNFPRPADVVSPAFSPRKKRQPAADSVRRASNTLTSDNTATSVSALGFQDKPMQKPAAASTSRTAGMLPTPSKTPQKPPNEKTAANIKAVARNLFPSEETAISSPRKKHAKKYSGLTLESFTAEKMDEPIEIYTDSQDRIPAKDESESNPFYGKQTQPEPRRRSKRRQVAIPGEGAQSIEEASRREDGMVYVFRGKKFFRKFAEPDDAEVEDLGELGSDVEDILSRPLTRSSIKPRLLFPTQKTKEMLEEEEAATDVEDLHMDDTPVNPQTPSKAKQERAQTPEAPRFAPVSPPATKRTTRSTNKLAGQGTPMKRASGKSPFDLWPRTKEHKAQPAGKRAGEPLASNNVKRARA